MTKTKKENQDHAHRANSGETAASQSNYTGGLTEAQICEAEYRPCQEGECPPCQGQSIEGFDMAVRELAYLKWEAAGFPSGDGFDFWLEAERELKVNRSASDTVPE